MLTETPLKLARLLQQAANPPLTYNQKLPRPAASLFPPFSSRPVPFFILDVLVDNGFQPLLLAAFRQGLTRFVGDGAQVFQRELAGGKGLALA